MKKLCMWVSMLLLMKTAFAQDTFTQAQENKTGYQVVNQPMIGFNEQYHNKMVGEWSLRQLNASAILLQDPWVQYVITDLAWQINAQARGQSPLAVLVISDDAINAFAIPGGVIGVNTGIITSAKSLDEVASVLAHEVAHLRQHHYERRMDARKRALMTQIGGLLATAIASKVDGDAAAAVMMGSQTAALNEQMAFSRDNEREADRIGMQILSQAGYDPKAMPAFFATLNQKHQINQEKNAYIPSFIQTHPMSSERLSEAQLRANRYPGISLKELEAHKKLFDLLYWRVKYLSQKPSQSILNSAAKQSQGAKLALVSWYAEHGRPQKAKALLNTLANSDIDQPLYAIVKADIFAKSGDWQQAYDILAAQQKIYPERRDLRLYLANAILHQHTLTNQEFSEISTLLKPLTQSNPADIQVWQTLQQASERLAKTEKEPTLSRIATINALRYRSQVEQWKNQYDSALTSLSIAKNEANKLPKSSAKSLQAMIDKETQNIEAAKSFKP